MVVSTVAATAALTPTIAPTFVALVATLVAATLFAAIVVEKSTDSGLNSLENWDDSTLDGDDDDVVGLAIFGFLPK